VGSMTCLNWKSEAHLRLSTRYHLGNGKPPERQLRGKIGALDADPLQIPPERLFLFTQETGGLFSEAVFSAPHFPFRFHEGDFQPWDAPGRG